MAAVKDVAKKSGLKSKDVQVVIEFFLQFEASELKKEDKPKLTVSEIKPKLTVSEIKPKLTVSEMKPKLTLSEMKAICRGACVSLSEMLLHRISALGLYEKVEFPCCDC